MGHLRGKKYMLELCRWCTQVNVMADVCWYRDFELRYCNIAP